MPNRNRYTTTQKYSYKIAAHPVENFLGVKQDFSEKFHLWLDTV
jgi:hypothetical protein